MRGFCDRLDQLGDDVRRRRPVGVAHAEIDDVATGGARLRLQRVDLGEDVGRQALDAVELGDPPSLDPGGTPVRDRREARRRCGRRWRAAVAQAAGRRHRGRTGNAPRRCRARHGSVTLLSGVPSVSRRRHIGTALRGGRPGDASLRVSTGTERDDGAAPRPDLRRAGRAGRQRSWARSPTGAATSSRTSSSGTRTCATATGTRPGSTGNALGRPSSSRCSAGRPSRASWSRRSSSSGRTT